jgi:perosamine synthetase
MFTGSLIPRFKYTYRFIDVFRSFALLFSKNFARDVLTEYFNTENIFFSNAGRTSLRIALTSLGLKPNAKIGVQVYNCETVFHSIKSAGYSPVFIDVTNDFILDVNDLERKKAGLDALIFTNTFGITTNIEEIKKITQDIPIIEDCAHSLLSRTEDGPSGTLSDISIFSIGYGKNPSIGDGGFIVCNNKKYLNSIKDEIKRLPKPGFILEIGAILKNYIWSIAHKRPFYGFITFHFKKNREKRNTIQNKGKKEYQAYKVNEGLFIENFRRYIKLNQLKKDKVKYFYRNIEFASKQSSDICNQNNYIIGLLSNHRDGLVDVLLENGFESGKHFHKSVNSAMLYGYIKGSCKNAESVVKNIFTVPVHYDIKYKKLDQLCRILNSYSRGMPNHEEQKQKSATL